MLFRVLVVAIFVALAPVSARADTFVLVHGAFQDARAWDEVVRRLERSGHTALAVNLPGRGNDTSKPHTQSIERYRDAVLAVVRAQSEPVILVGHSFGGITISAVAEAAPDRIRRLVYLAGYLPRSGESLQTLSSQDHNNKFTQQNFVVASDYSTAHVLPKDAALIFANDARGARQAAIARSLQPEPLPPMAMPVVLTPERFGRAQKAYIFTLRDNAISLPMQRLMVERTPVAQNFDIDSGHAPFATQPRRLTQLLLRIAHQ